jgi:UDP-N-acetylmuramoyl-tripeptide--D-alanyl-D-alanine ligase
MSQFKIAEILEATNGKFLQGHVQSRVRRVTTNSRDVKKGDLFIAIVGKKHDAHDFIVDVVKKGAVGIVVSKNVVGLNPSVAVVKVADTTLALGDIARFHRQRFNIPVIAITGSAGKTTTKEMIAAVLKTKYRVLKNIGTENNQFGVPLTILKMKSSDEIAVLEVGTNTPGDIPWLASIVQPTVAVMTNIGESHLELLKTPADVFKEKFALVKALREHGTAIINHDDRFLAKVPAKIIKKSLTFGIQQKSAVQAKAVTVIGNRIHFKIDRVGNFTLPGTATANIYNALAAICCGRLFKVGYPDIKNVLKKFSFKSGRQAFVKAGQIALIDDTYNANPVSFRSALQAIGQQQCRGRRVLICADMLELGLQSERYHREIGTCAALAGIDAIFSYGKFAKEIGLAAKTKNIRVEIFHGATPESVEEKVKNYFLPGDTVLVKGSRGMKTERFVEFIKKNYQGR